MRSRGTIRLFSGRSKGTGAIPAFPCNSIFRPIRWKCSRVPGVFCRFSLYLSLNFSSILSKLNKQQKLIFFVIHLFVSLITLNSFLPSPIFFFFYLFVPIYSYPFSYQLLFHFLFLSFFLLLSIILYPLFLFSPLFLTSIFLFHLFIFLYLFSFLPLIFNLFLHSISSNIHLT